MERVYCVYLLASRSRNLYTGVTGNLDRRMLEHRQGLIPGFTSRYRIFRLVHFEQFASIHEAIAREKEIKGWSREKKLWLIKRNNPRWEDLAANLSTKYKTESRSLTAVRQNQATGFGMTPFPREGSIPPRTNKK
jgi:putative endonuclease